MFIYRFLSLCVVCVVSKSMFCMYMCVFECLLEENIFQCSSTVPLQQGLTLKQKLCVSVKLAGPGESRIWPPPPSNAGVQSLWGQLFQVDSWDSISDPHPYTASVLPHWAPFPALETDFSMSLRLCFFCLYFLSTLSTVLPWDQSGLCKAVSAFMLTAYFNLTSFT